MKNPTKHPIPKDKYALLIGGMKCGTRSLYHYIKDHPDICECKVKEPEYFTKNQNRSYSVAQYEDLWDYDPSRHKIVLEASTGYTKYPVEKDIPKQIFEQDIQAKFIYLVRNPFERIVSHHNFMKTNPNFTAHKGLIQEHYINVSSYYWQLSQYLEYFPDKGRYLVIDSADFFTDTPETLSRIFQFLEIDTNYIPQEYEVKNKSMERSKLEVFLFRSGLIQLSKYVPKNLTQNLKRGLNRLPKDKKTTFTPTERKIVRERLADDMQQLQQEFGIDVQKWGFDA